MAVRNSDLSDPGGVVEDADVVEMEVTLRDFAAFMDDPHALIERALYLLRQKRNEIATYIVFGVLAVHLWGEELRSATAVALS